jgi:hypothetical protein
MKLINIFLITTAFLTSCMTACEEYNDPNTRENQQVVDSSGLNIKF